MATVGNSDPAREWNPNDPFEQAPLHAAGTFSGRGFVLAAVVVVLLIWGAVYLGFRSWRANYEALAQFGATEIAPLVDPLGDQVPPGTNPAEWRQAVADTHGMLLALTGSALLDRPMMEVLKAEVAVLVARSTPDTSRRELTALWDDLERKAGPVISPDVTPAKPGSRHASRHPRPARPAILKSK